MNIKSLIKIGVILLILDYIYLSLLGSHFKKEVKNIQGKSLKMRLSGAIFCYILLIIGLYYFIIKKSEILTKKENMNNLHQYIKDAAILGFIIYGVFDATNHAIFDKWTIKSLIIDSIWGGILYSLTTYLYFKF